MGYITINNLKSIHATLKSHNHFEKAVEDIADSKEADEFRYDKAVNRYDKEYIKNCNGRRIDFEGHEWDGMNDFTDSQNQVLTRLNGFGVWIDAICYPDIRPEIMEIIGLFMHRESRKEYRIGFWEVGRSGITNPVRIRLLCIMVSYGIKIMEILPNAREYGEEKLKVIAINLAHENTKSADEIKEKVEKLTIINPSMTPNEINEVLCGGRLNEASGVEKLLEYDGSDFGWNATY